MANKMTECKTKERKQSHPQPSATIAILEYLIRLKAFTPERAVHISSIAKAVGEDQYIVEFDLLGVIAPGCAIVETYSFNRKPTRRFFVAADEAEIESAAQSFRAKAVHANGRAELLEQAAWAMEKCCPPYLFRRSQQ